MTATRYRARPVGTVYVTGGASGLGAAVVEAVGEAGGRPAVLDLKSPSAGVPSVEVDLADTAAAAVRELSEMVGPPQAVVTAAGIDACGPWLPALAASVAGARLLVCGDTGIAHLATSLGTAFGAAVRADRSAAVGTAARSRASPGALARVTSGTGRPAPSGDRPRSGTDHCRRGARRGRALPQAGWRNSLLNRPTVRARQSPDNPRESRECSTEHQALWHSRVTGAGGGRVFGPWRPLRAELEPAHPGRGLRRRPGVIM